MTNLKTVVTFFEAYQRHDPDTMFKSLHPYVEFSDLAFERITGDDVRAMWRWFCQKPVAVPFFEIVQVDGDSAQVRYQVQYSLNGKHTVDYVIQADLELRGGKIVRQVDTATISEFAFARMAMGFPKCLLALTPLFKPLVRSRMRGSLNEFRKTQGRPAEHQPDNLCEDLKHVQR